MLPDFILSLVLTLILEGVVALLWRLRERDILLFVLVNVLTNPAVVLLHALLPGWGMVILLELGAVAVEGMCYARLGAGIRRPWLFALAANVFSFCLGLGINKLI